VPLVNCDGLGFGVWVWGVGLRVEGWGLGFRSQGSGLHVPLTKRDGKQATVKRATVADQSLHPKPYTLHPKP
jgi:hypothetical protein